MGLFKKRTGQEREGPGSLLAGRIASGILSRQRKWADYLNAKTRRVSVRNRLVGLLLFCLVSGSYLLYLLISSIF